MSKGCPILKNWAALLGRICLSTMFILAGAQKIIKFNSVVGVLANAGLPKPEWLLILGIIFELGGGLLVFLGLFARFGAFLLFIFVLLVNFLFHAFWTFQAPEAVNQALHFMKGFAIVGGFLYIMAFGAGNYSFDRFRKRPEPLV